MDSTADTPIKQIDGVLRGREQGQRAEGAEYHPHLSPLRSRERDIILPVASLRLSSIPQCGCLWLPHFDFRMAFDMAGKRVGVEHNSAQDFLREEFQGHHKARQGNCFSGKREYQVIIWLFVNLHSF